jgi:3-hydroxyacyl-CoA dehydrogenase
VISFSSRRITTSRSSQSTNPPVNALNLDVRHGICKAIDHLQLDETIKAAVLVGGGRTFVTGADIKDFGKMTSGQIERGAGMLPMLLRIEDSRKPIVAAIHGNASGGGLELAMACHYRVAMAMQMSDNRR